MSAVARPLPPEGRANLPSVDRVLAWPQTRPLVERYGRRPVTDAIRGLLSEARAGGGAPTWTASAVAEKLAAILEKQNRPKLRRVLNLTGTVLHTNLGRALLPEEAVQAAALAMRSACNLEYDLESGKRGDRDTVVEESICALTGGPSRHRGQQQCRGGAARPEHLGGKKGGGHLAR